MAIAVLQLAGRQGVTFAVGHRDVAIDQNIGHLAPVSPPVHAHEAAHGAGDAAQEFEPGDTCIARGAGDQDTMRPGPAGEHVTFTHLDLGEGLAEADGHAGHPAIAHDQIGAQPQRHHWQLPVERFEELLEIDQVSGFEQPVGVPPRLEPHQRCERRIAHDAATHAFGRHHAHRHALDRAVGCHAVVLARPAGDRHGHADCRSVATASARLAAHLVISPAPRQTM